MDILPTTLCGIPPRDNLTHRYPSHGYRPHGHPFPHGHSTHGHPSPWKSVPLMLLPWANLPHEHPFPKDTLPHRCSSYGHLFPTATHPQRHLTEPAWFTWVLCHTSQLSPQILRFLALFSHFHQSLCVSRGHPSPTLSATSQTQGEAAP